VKRLCVIASAAAAALAAATGAASGAGGQPVLAYVTGTATGTPQAWVGRADGSHARKLGSGQSVLVSPDGKTVAATQFNAHGPALLLYPSGGGHPAKYFTAKQYGVSLLAWSPDSRYLAVDLSNNLTINPSKSGLAVIDTATRATGMIATGAIAGASFSPSGPDEIAYARSANLSFNPPTNVFTAAPDGSGTTQITHDGVSLEPVWGTRGIAFDVEKPRHNDAPIYQLWLMRPDGTHRAQITHMHIPTLVSGLSPLTFAADGRHLLAQYVGQDTDEAWTVDVATGKLHRLIIAGQTVTPDSISSDGKAVLVDFGAFMNPPSQGTIETIGFGGSGAKVLVKHAAGGSWNR
jgi:WD40 repeat protein